MGTFGHGGGVDEISVAEDADEVGVDLREADPSSGLLRQRWCLHPGTTQETPGQGPIPGESSVPALAGEGTSARVAEAITVGPSLTGPCVQHNKAVYVHTITFWSHFESDKRVCAFTALPRHTSDWDKHHQRQRHSRALVRSILSTAANQITIKSYDRD
ncbi:hypothetical protein J6590_079557 [Homalodisca vitripennis]|nr:hypothetical protein J6590_079557 [Homalodisca vitripennis]